MIMESANASVAAETVFPGFAPPVAASRTSPVYCGGRTVAGRALAGHALAGHAVERYEFDAQYVQRLTEGDPSVEQHFTSYFGPLIRIKLRRHGWTSHDVEDVMQDTFLRVLQTLRQKGGLEHPERLGAFVYSVCHNVTLEFHRARERHPNADPDRPEDVDESVDIHGALVSEERKKLVRLVLDGLPAADRDLLRMTFMEEASREEICAKMNVDRGYLRVLLHRARGRFKALAKTTALAASW